jgi:hypothetical protein
VYDRTGNAVRTPVTAGQVILSGVSTGNAIVVAGGTYAFPGLANGGYQVRANVSMASGGITTADAFLINTYLSNPTSLSGLAIQAADANGDGLVNSADALLVLQRSINLPTAVFATQWVSENASVTVNNTNPVRDIAVLSRGDVNRDYSFGARLIRGIEVEQGSVLTADQPVTILPVVATANTVLGSLQMHLKLAGGLVVRSIRMTRSGEQILFNQVADQLYLGWYASNGALVAEAGAGLFEIEFDQDIRGYEQVLTVIGFSQATDFEANPYSQLRLQTPTFVKGAGLSLQVGNYPNPFSASTEIIYQLPEEGMVQMYITDFSGKEIYRSAKMQESAGDHNLHWSAGDVADGVYMLHIRFEGATITRSKSTKLMIRR